MHLTPAIGRLRLERLTAAHVQALLDSKLASGLAPRSVQACRRVLGAALKQGMRWQMVARNVAELLNGPKVRNSEMRVFSPEQARRFLAACEGDRFQALYLLRQYRAARGERLALQRRMTISTSTWEHSASDARSGGAVLKASFSRNPRRHKDAAPSGCRHSSWPVCARLQAPSSNNVSRPVQTGGKAVMCSQRALALHSTRVRRAGIFDAFASNADYRRSGFTIALVSNYSAQPRRTSRNRQ